MTSMKRMFDTNDFFTKGKLSILLDGGAGSSGKGCLGSFLCAYADNYQFVCNSFAPQAGHWVKLDDGRSFFYQTLNSCAYQDRYEKMYIGPGGMIELPAFAREMEENNVKPHRIGIHPLVSILQDKDAAFERGEIDLDGNRIKSEGTMKFGSTCHGVGAAKVRKVLRRKDVLLARDVPQLKEFLCNTSTEIMQRLNSGQAGLLELAQGFQLSMNLNEMYPYCTSRNVTVAAGFDDMMLPVIYAGNVVINFRTFPIRINNNKYLDPENNKHLTWPDVQEYEKTGKKYTIYKGNSGPGYDDQEETTWDEVTKQSKSQVPIIEMTSVTKLPRRVFTFSKKNLEEAIIYNRTPGKTFISINFANYVDSAIKGVRGNNCVCLTPQFTTWFAENVVRPSTILGALVKYIGTGPLTDDKIVIPASETDWIPHAIQELRG